MTTGRAPAVLALTCALVAAGLLGIATPAQLFGGLSNGGVITIAAMLVIAKGVLHTGVVSRATYRLLSGVTTAGQALRRLIPPVGVVSALINTTPIVAMLHSCCQRARTTVRGTCARGTAAHRPCHHPGRVGHPHRHQLQPAHRRPGRTRRGQSQYVLVCPDRGAGGPRWLGGTAARLTVDAARQVRGCPNAAWTGVRRSQCRRTPTPLAERRPSWASRRHPTSSCPKSVDGVSRWTQIPHSTTVTSWSIGPPSPGCGRCGRSPIRPGPATPLPRVDRDRRARDGARPRRRRRHRGDRRPDHGAAARDARQTG